MEENNCTGNYKIVWNRSIHKDVSVYKRKFNIILIQSIQCVGKKIKILILLIKKNSIDKDDVWCSKNIFHLLLLHKVIKKIKT